jgi:hypothetical protein
VDRNGPAQAASHAGELTLWFSSTPEGELDRMLVLDRYSAVVARRVLELVVPEPEDDLDDLSEEELLPPPSVLDPLREGARLAVRCKCPEPWAEAIPASAVGTR